MLAYFGFWLKEPLDRWTADPSARLPRPWPLDPVPGWIPEGNLLDPSRSSTETPPGCPGPRCKPLDGIAVIPVSLLGT